MNIRVAVVGAGGIASDHLEAAAKMEELAPCAVADVQEDRAASMAARYGMKAYSDYKQMLQEEKPDIAVITLPHFLHREAAIFAAEQGCHILLEKPMALNTAECDEIAEAVSKAGVKLLVGHTQHYTETNRAAKRWIEEGRLGRLVMMNDRRHLPYDKPTRPDWFFERAKAGGGILTNLGSHTVDKIQWLIDGRITKVKASVDYFLGRGDIEGGGTAFFETSKGIPAAMSQSGYPGVPIDETELLFTKGSMKLISGVGLWVSEGGSYRQVEVSIQENPFVLQFQDLLDSIREDVEPSCSIAYSRSVVAVVESIYLSNQSGCERIVNQGGEPIA
ncbi:Gfo/Idh/MocA family oxidoreductase [Paenibacillus sp. HB172176]|uniref:Gfo/Idh/MocA family protein n=1 Tax=Paenibacillus sp. HB172176 TaxID=2493690 RepID=UPI00143BEF08|nr:Gfo/Idh/MocA family oxidoreductase [Paenibacillus sp. HB172176]